MRHPRHPWAAMSGLAVWLSVLQECDLVLCVRIGVCPVRLVCKSVGCGKLKFDPPMQPLGVHSAELDKKSLVYLT